MCLFTHFAAGALAGGATGHVGWAAVAGAASHAVLDAIPHYDHPDWRLELAGGVAALLLLLAMPFVSPAAVVGGLTVSRVAGTISTYEKHGLTLTLWYASLLVLSLLVGQSPGT